MSKTWIVFKKEYLTRVQKKTFIIMTILVPIIFLLFTTLPILMTSIKSGTTQIAILDESGHFAQSFENKKSLQFHFVQGNLNEIKEQLAKKDKKKDFDALLYIPKFDLKYPGGFKIYSENQVGMMNLSYIENRIKNTVENLRFIEAGIDKDKIEELKVKIDLESIVLQETGEKKGNAIVSIALSQIMGFFQYFMIFFYGSLIMRAISEEKKNRIIEVIVSSIRPFQLMLGKILGIAAVALTQLAIWIVLISIILVIFSTFFMPYLLEQQEVMGGASTAKSQELVQMLTNIEAFNIPLMIFSFAFFFIFGYLFYSALFAGAGSVTDDDAQNQTITLPISLPIIFSLFIMINVAEQPHTPLAVWSSLIPFCSPIIMIARLPFGVPAWQLITSMLLLVIGFLINTWLAGKVYRIGILLYGKKVNWKDIFKWIRVK